MSINVTVSGNPISIKRGKMVTSDTYQTKNEHEKKRLMRLEQVRQQSKRIAEDVRNKVRKEKKKQLRQIEEEGKEKLKNWQNKKLQELKAEYEEALQELGTGHKEAAAFIDENEIMAQQKELNDKMTRHRAQVAATKLQIDKNKENLKKAIPIQQKKLVRDIENIRASLVSNIKENKSDKTKKTLADINITIPSSHSESSDGDLPEVGIISERDKLSNVEEKDEPVTSCSEETDVSDTFRPLLPSKHVSKPVPAPKSNHPVSPSKRSVSPSKCPVSPQPRQPTATTGISDLAKQISERRKLIEEYQNTGTTLVPPLDTRISDRIKRRELMASQLDYCDTVAKTNPIPFIESNTQLRDAVESRVINNLPIEINCICGHKCPDLCGSRLIDKNLQVNNSEPGLSMLHKPKQVSTVDEIPEKPPVKLKDKYNRDKTVADPSRETLDTYDSHKVNFYDHPNRFSHDKILPSNSHVERITADSLEVMPNEMSEKEWQQKVKRRDREAQVRGKRALEKEKIQKDYEEMLRKLPLLQKKERICEIAKDKQEYHMSEERLMERDRKKQNDLDNAFSKLFPNLKPAVVTLPSKNQAKDDGKIPANEPVQSLNVGSWDVDHEEPKMFTAEEVQEIVKAFTEQKPKDRRLKLKQLLKSLKLQKEQLINEIKSLPSNNSINELISDLRSFSDSDEKHGKRRKKGEKSVRKRRREEHDKETSTDSSTESTSTSLTKHGITKGMKDKHKEHHPSDTKTPSPRKKPKIKYKKKVLILQNMSTQTTPKAASSSDLDQDKVKSKILAEDKEQTVCPKLHIPCDCNKENESTDELCHIVIKINDNDDPEVVVKAKEKKLPILDVRDKGKSPTESPKDKKKELKSIGVGTDERKDSARQNKGDGISNETRANIGDKPKTVPTKKPPSVTKTFDSTQSKTSERDTESSKAKSWREQLSKNSVSTSSTSYMSPPDFQKSADTQPKLSKDSLYYLHKKPQQSNVHDLSSALSISASLSSADHTTVDPRLLAYVKKLLSMSRGSVENLTASTSNVQTPSQSVIEMESNNPLAQFQDVIKYYNLRNIGRDLSYSPDLSPIHYNTSASTSEVSQPKQDKSSNFPSDHVSKSGKTDQSSRGTIDKEMSSSSARSKDSVLAQYADVTDSCSKRIAQLTAMIEQLRQEKIQMLHHPPAAEGAEKDYSTAYLDLPGSNESSSKYSSINSLDDEELQRRLLEIDFSLAEKLRRFATPRQDKSSEEDNGERENAGSSNAMDERNLTNAELWSRLNRLKQPEEQPSKIVPAEIPKEDLQFVPFLSDIPKLPKLEAQPENSKSELNSSLHKRPPPSRGLSVAKKFNGNISLVPHELSTIHEADSQLSTKIGSANNSRTSQDLSPRKDYDLVDQPEIEDDENKQSAMSKKTSPMAAFADKHKCDDRCTYKCSRTDSLHVEKSPRKNRTPPSTPVPNVSLDSSNQSIVLACSKTSSKKSLTSSSSDDMETIESMLKSIGMEWAIPTLHKTKEALALTSSSSSLVLSSKKQVVSSNTSGSEVSLKQYLEKQIKISSSTMKSDGSPASFSGELSELSSIQVNNSQADKSNQRTSTPVVSSKSTTEKSGKKVVFSGDSDISSVRNDSQRNSDKSNKISYRTLEQQSQSDASYGQ